MPCANCGAARPDGASFCPTCGKSVVAVIHPPGNSLLSSGVLTADDVAFFNVGTTKLVLMTIATFGIYDIYWLYKNWSTEQALSRESISPFWRAFFAPLFIYALAARARDRSVSMDMPTTLQPGLIAVAFILLSIATRAPDPFWLIGILAGVALVPIQNELARINTARGIGPGDEARYSAINIAWLTLSALLWLLIIAGMMLPEVE